ncbi:MAG: sigma-70 family RNA polymerase sigma factor [Bacteroidota bacterium]
MKDTEILALLKEENDKSSNVAFRAIYQQVFPLIRRMVLDTGGSEEQALDTFQDTSLIFFNNVTADRYKSNSTISTYLYSIARNQWFVQLKKEKRLPRGGSVSDVDISDVNTEENQELETTKIVERFFNKLDDGCQQLLKMYYYDNKSMKQIMESFNLGSEQAAKTKKFRCMKKLQGLFKSYRIDRNSFNI